MAENNKNLSDRELLLLIVQEVQQKLPVIESRLNSHASDIKSLREWRYYSGGAIAAIAAYFGFRITGR